MAKQGFLPEEEYIDFCLYCGADAEYVDKHIWQDGTRYRVYVKKCLPTACGDPTDKNCGKEQVLIKYPTRKQIKEE